MPNNHLTVYYIYSPWLRIFHWLMVISILVLFVTGLYIAKPLTFGNAAIEPTLAAGHLSLQTIRDIHFFFSFLFVAAFILRVYGFIINKGDRLLPRFWTVSHWRWTKDILLHYLLVRPEHNPYLRNPLARMSYLAVYSLIAIEALTGFAMYYMTDPNGWGARLFGPINHFLGGEFVVHLVHHYVAWLIVIFAIVHVYMAVRADFMEREGEISSMFSGVKFFEHQPVDYGEIRSDDQLAGYR